MVLSDVGNRLAEAAQAVRDRTVAVVVRDYEPIATRLEAAYQSVVGVIEVTISQLPDALNLASSGTMTDEEIRLALEAWRAQIERELAVMHGSISGLAGELESVSVRSGYQIGIANLQAGGMDVAVSQNTLAIIQQGINIVDSAPFQQAVSQYAPYHANQIADIVVAAVARGESPRVAARLVRDYLVNSRNPENDALRLMRTTQMYTVRTATAYTYQESGVDEWMWVAALDDRTCMGCICMHGTIHSSREVLNDHHNGRCAMMPITPSWTELGLSGGTDFVDGLETGPEWFENQSAEVQREIMGPQLYEAYQQGLIPFSPDVIVGTYTNSIFGEMRRPRTNEAIFSLLGIVR